MATIKKEEYPINGDGFEYLGKHYDCELAIKRDIKMILQEAEISHKDTFDELYDRNTLRADKIRIFVDGDDVPIYGMIIYLIDYKEQNNSRCAPISRKHLLVKEKRYEKVYTISICNDTGN